YGEKLAERFLEFVRDDRPRQRRIAVLRAQLLSPELVAKLNANAQQGRRRVTELIDCLKSIFGKPLGGARAVGRQMSRCNRLLGRYRVRWAVAPALTEGEFGSLELNRAASYCFVEVVAPRGSVTTEECHAVRAVMKLTEIGALQKLRTCKQCGLWFYAR